MKSRFSTIDIRAAIADIRERFLSMRVVNVYDIDNRTYMIKLALPDKKGMILLESGNRIHSTEFEWPKNFTPSGFSMKMRKHLRGRRLENIQQLGIDRIVDLQFGSGEAAFHIVLELYDRGNIVLTDFEYNILNILRPRADDSQDVRFAVREIYPLNAARQAEPPITEERMREYLLSGKDGDNLKKILNPKLVYGPALIEHCLIGAGISANARIGKEFDITTDMPKLMSAMVEAEEMFKKCEAEKCAGYIIQKAEKKVAVKEGESTELLTYNEFHPFLFRQHELQPHFEVETFNKAVDEFFSKLESQKMDMKVLNQEKTALKKLDNVRKDHEKRVEALQKDQENDTVKGRLIEMNQDLVDKALLVVRSAIANQIDWAEINAIVKEAQAQGDPVASAIRSLKLESNHMTMFLKDPYADSESDGESDEDRGILKPMKIDIDLSVSAYANARRYYDMKRTAAKKEQKTVDASVKALKSAERKTKLMLKEVAVTATINKARKTYWFEKFLWFISSENYLVIGGRDQQQNEIIVKRYLKAGDLYVHADLHGATSVIIKNHEAGEPIPPKTLNEAGTMAICHSAAWDAKVVTSAWYVHHDQVSKTAPTGEYLTTGSFMIRGKKNYLPPSYLIYGFGFLFKLDEDCLSRHAGERRVRTAEEDAMSITESESSEVVVELAESDDDDDEIKSVETVENSEQKKTSVVNSDGSEIKQNIDISPSVETGDVTIEDLEESETVKNNCAASKNIDTGNRTEESSGDSAASSEVKLEGGSEVAVVETGNVKAVAMETPVAMEIPAVATETPVAKEEDDSSDEESLFPDTHIQLQHVKGDKYQLQSYVSPATEGEDIIDFLTSGSNKAKDDVNRPVKLSAKQRRDMKKAKKQQQATSEQENRDEVGTEGITGDMKDTGEKQPEENKRKQKQQRQEQLQQQPQQPPKRGQKAKLKKIKDKYKDQDEEERRLKMEILQSSGPPKEEKKKKGKKGKQQEAQQNKGAKQQQQQQQGKKQPPKNPLTGVITHLEDMTVNEAGDQPQLPASKAALTEQKTNAKTDQGHMSEEEKEGEEEEKTQTNVDVNILDSLTGQPIVDDVLLYVVPIAAPYSALSTYKYKVKLTPGSGKRGKATKTAVQMFNHDKLATQREKDLFRSVKDVDLSRNIPGKVKVSAPNLHKKKGK